jgi:hypothetical protein
MVGEQVLSAYGVAESGVEHLGLVRVIDGVLQDVIYPLSTGPQGTVIGSVESMGACIMDVEPDVSPQHLVVWCQEGRWWCQGLESANGTALISGATKELVSVESPRKLRVGEKPHPVELQPGDALCLGLRTRFLVLRLEE